MTNNGTNRLLKSLDYFFVLRPMLFFPGWSTLLAGYLITLKSRYFLSLNKSWQLNYGEIGLLLFIFAAAMGASFLLNQLADVQSDLKNKKLFLISEGHIPKQNAIIEVLFLSLLALILSILQGIAIFISILIFIVLTGYLYNFQPFKFKDKPWWSLWANAGMGFLAFAVGWLAAMPEFSWQLVTDALPYLFLNTALYFFTTLPDVEGDRIAGKQTLAVKFGIKQIIWASFILFVLSLFSAVWLNDHLALLIIVPAVPFFLFTIIKPQVSSTILATKFTILFFAVAICLKIPYYFLLMLAGYFATRWYFKARFNYNYPNFKGQK